MTNHVVNLVKYLTYRTLLRTIWVQVTRNEMTMISITNARTNLYRLVDEAVQTHKPVVIAGKRGNAVLLAEEDWNSINETLYLLSIPGMRESIVDGINTNLEECDQELDW